MDFPAILDPTSTLIDNGHHYHQACDESRCVSKGISYLYGDSPLQFNSLGVVGATRLDDLFTCYGNQNSPFYPMLCADGFHPVVVPDEPLVNATGMYGSGDISLQYFTCCPPGYTSEQPPTRHCSDPVIAPENSEADAASLCGNEGARRYPRQSKIWWTPNESFFCCDNSMSLVSDDDNNATAISENYASNGANYASNGANYTSNGANDYLDEVDCVPYRNDFYDVSMMVPNILGFVHLNGIYCAVPEGDFFVPRSIPNRTVTTGLYQCCKTGPGLPPFVQDSTFNIQVYTWLVIASVAAVCVAVVAIGLLLPLLIQLNDGTYRRAVEQMSLSRVSVRRLSIRTISGVGAVPPYSPYNLYLVYLAIPDLINSLYYIFGVCVPMICQRLYPLPLIVAFNFGYLTANIWLNAIVSYQVLDLLKGSRRRERVPPPSLTRVNLQALGVYSLSTAAFLVNYFGIVEYERAANNGNFARSSTFELITLCWNGSVLLPPILYVVYVSGVCWCCGYIRSIDRASQSGGAMRALAIYFLRIVYIFYGVWIPSIMLVVYAYTQGPGSGLALFLSLMLTLIQPIASTCMILTSPVVRRYTKDLVTLSYMFERPSTSYNGSSSLR